MENYVYIIDWVEHMGSDLVRQTDVRAKNPSDALRIFIKRYPEVMILDILRKPTGDGLDVNVKEEKKVDGNRYNTKVRRAMSDRLKKCSKDKYEAERRIIDINNEFLTKQHEFTYVQACELIEERKRLEKDIERLTIERNLWDAAREICMDIADEMCKEAMV